LVYFLIFRHLSLETASYSAQQTTSMIVKAEAKDLLAIAALNHAAYREMGTRVPEWANEEFWHSLVTMRVQQATFFVLRQADTVVGSVAYCSPGRSVDPVPASWASVLLLAVDPKHRGKGYGCLLASECMKLAKHDQAAVGLFTSELMGAARRLYEGLGFGVERELPPRHGLRYWLYRYDVQSEEDERVRKAA